MVRVYLITPQSQFKNNSRATVPFKALGEFLNQDFKNGFENLSWGVLNILFRALLVVHYFSTLQVLYIQYYRILYILYSENNSF